jgi:hypothetical protein
MTQSKRMLLEEGCEHGAQLKTQRNIAFNFDAQVEEGPVRRQGSRGDLQ